MNTAARAGAIHRSYSHLCNFGRDRARVVTFDETTATTGGQVLATITVRWDDSVAQWAFGTAPSTAPPPTTVTLQSVL